MDNSKKQVQVTSTDLQLEGSQAPLKLHVKQLKLISQKLG